MHQKTSTNPLAFIIEDDEKLSVIYNEALQQAAFDTLLIHDGTIALERLQTLTPAVVILDLHLPRTSGNKVLSQIREDARLAHTQVVITTADAVQAEALRQDTDFVLIKPISFLQLRDLAKRLRTTLP